MATITITSAPEAIRIPWDKATAMVGGSSPPLNQAIGKFVFAADFAVAAKISTNETLVQMTATLPPGFFYRIQELWFTGQGDDAGRFFPTSAFQLAARGIVTEAGVTTFQFAMINNIAKMSGAAIGAIAIQPASVTNNFQTWFLPEVQSPIQQFLINASEGSSQVLLAWVDISADATTAIQVQWRLEVLQFTIEQGISAGPNSPVLTFAG